MSGWVDGVCVTCGERRTADGHDPCIANLPDVVFACCGHGVGEVHDGTKHTSCYVVFSDNTALYGNAARAAMEMLGGSPPPIPADATTRSVTFEETGADRDELNRLLRRRT